MKPESIERNPVRIESIPAVEAVAIISAIVTVLFICLIIECLRSAPNESNQKAGLKSLCSILILALCGLAWGGVSTFKIHHDFRVIYGWDNAQSTIALAQRKQKVATELVVRRQRAEENIARYQQVKKNLETASRSNLTQGVSLESTLFTANDELNVYRRARVSAYFAGYRDEVLAVPDIEFAGK